MPLQTVNRKWQFDRLTIAAALIVACFVSVLLLSSQSRASLPTYLLAVLMLATVLNWKDVLQVPIMRWILALVAWMSLSVLWSDPFSWRDAASIWVRALLIVCFVVAFAECQLRGYLQRWMTTALTIFGALVVLVAIVNFVLTNPEDGRLNGLGQLDTHVVAALVYGVVFLFVLQHFLRSTSLAMRCSLGFVLAVIASAILLSDSRNAWVSVTIGSIMLVLSWRVIDVRQYGVALASAAVLLFAALVVLMFNETTLQWLLPRGDSFRLAIWSHALERIVDGGGVMTGLGITTIDDLRIDGLLFQHPHNLYLAVVFQAGLVGLLLYLTVIAQSVRKLLHHYEHPDAKLALAILGLGLSAHMLDGHELIDKVGETWFLVWLPVAVALGCAWKEPRRA